MKKSNIFFLGTAIDSFFIVKVLKYERRNKKKIFVKKAVIWEGLNLKDDHRITQAKLELMQKIINAHLTKEELRVLTEYTCGLIQNREEGEKKK